MIRSHDVRLFTFIMGNSANRPLLTTITDASNGFAMSVSNSDDIVGSILLAQSKVTHEALHGAQLKIKGIKTFDLTPKKIGSLYRGQQLTMFGHYSGGGQAEVSLSGRISGEEKVYQTDFTFPETSTANPELEQLWAYASIEQLNREIEDFGEDADMKQAITDLGIQYGLVTDYTSIVVVRDQVFKQLGIERRNSKRLQRAIWRLLTGHFIPCDLSHLLWNLLPLALIGGLLEQRISCLGVSGWIWFGRNELLFYCGLSGMLNGLLAVLLVVLLVRIWQENRHPMLPLIGLVAVLKIIVETTMQEAIFTHLSWAGFFPKPMGPD